MKITETLTDLLNIAESNIENSLAADLMMAKKNNDKQASMAVDLLSHGYNDMDHLTQAIEDLADDGVFCEKQRAIKVQRYLKEKFDIDVIFNMVKTHKNMGYDHSENRMFFADNERASLGMTHEYEEQYAS